MLIEAIWLVSRRGWCMADAATLLLPGALIVLALRAALVGAGWEWVAVPLMLSLPVHVFDVRRRMRAR